MDIVFCLDRRMLDGLHVVAYSLLENSCASADDVQFHIFSDDLTEEDLEMLQETLCPLNKGFEVQLYRIDSERFNTFPSLNESLATYYRLLVPHLLDLERFLYLDVDMLCRTNLAPLFEEDLGDCPVGMVPEALVGNCIDSTVRNLLNEVPEDHPYFNAGVLLVDAIKWKEEGLTEKCLTFVSEHQPQFHDQSAMNYILRNRIKPLPEQYNVHTNGRRWWPCLKAPTRGKGCHLHFVDYPKPWDPASRFFHPMGTLWHRYFRKTALYGTSQAREIRDMRKPQLNKRLFKSYQKSAKDALLFGLYSASIVKRVKGIPE
ncbi:MAG: glycosyltransferase family 8 protein [Puniceicoccaceae bacterium]